MARPIHRREEVERCNFRFSELNFYVPKREGNKRAKWFFTTLTKRRSEKLRVITNPCYDNFLGDWENQACAEERGKA